MGDCREGRRVLQVGAEIDVSGRSERRTVPARKPADYPAVPPVYLDVAVRLSSPLLTGPPLCDELIEFVRHLFTEEEAGVVRHLGAVRARSAARVARREHRPLEQVEPILRRLARVKRAIGSIGPEGRERYHLMPIMPGIFEMVLVGEHLDALSPWHRRFAELFEALYETGYIQDYLEGQRNPPRVIRVLPVGRAIDAHPMALPSDQLEVVLERFDTFGVGQCQCRTAEAVVGRGCDKPRGNCTVMGQWAQMGIRDGWLRQVPRAEVLQIKREAESHGLVTWIMNVESARGQVSCSCCGCCCHAFRTVSEFNAPSMIAPPHFTPRFDLARCTFCGRCAARCPMRALTVDAPSRTHRREAARCVGCGLCVLACRTPQAAVMEAVPGYRLPYRSWFAMLLGNAPGTIRGAWNAWRKRP